MRRWLPVVLLALPLHADTLADLKTVVARLGARQPVRATYATEGSIKATGRFANDTFARTVSAEVAHDADGVTITIPQALVQKASDANDDAQSAIGSIRSMSVVEALDYREAFLELINHGTVVEEKRLPFRGAPTRFLVLKLNIPRKKANEITIGKVKVAEDRLHLWVGDNNLPLAAERVRKVSAGILMFQGKTEQRTNFTFSQTGDRLILARLETSSSGSALGQKFSEASVQTLTVH